MFRLKHRHCLLAFILSWLAQPIALAQDVLFLPVFSSQPETGLQFGLAGVWEQNTEPDALALNVFALGSTERQFRANVQLQTQGWLARRQDRLQWSLIWRDFPDVFYGYQAEYRHTGLSFSEHSIGGSVRWLVPLNNVWETGVGLRYLRSDVRFNESDPVLLDGVAGVEGSSLWGLTGVLQRDTRNSVDWPSRGTLIMLELNAAYTDQHTWPLGSMMAVTHFRALHPQLIWASGLQLQAATAQTPFLIMPELSGTQWLRGVRSGQYRHQTTVAAQSELRAEVSPRWAVVGFTHIAQVGIKPQAWFDSNWQWGGGTGVRFSVSRERRLNLRLDYGVVNGRGGAVFSFGEAF